MSALGLTIPPANPFSFRCPLLLQMSVLGLTIDYGPYGFMEWFDPDFTPNGSDNGGRYTYAAQPDIW
jgi:hypothetical protein